MSPYAYFSQIHYVDVNRTGGGFKVLGVPIGYQTGTSGTVVCPFCQASADSFGDHFLCCKYQFHSRHEAVVRSLTCFLRAGGLRVENEVAIRGRERSADIFLDHWNGGEPAAIDVTFTHPLAPSLGLNAHAVSSALTNKEQHTI